MSVILLQPKINGSCINSFAKSTWQHEKSKNIPFIKNPKENNVNKINKEKIQNKKVNNNNKNKISIKTVKLLHHLLKTTLKCFTPRHIELKLKSRKKSHTLHITCLKHLDSQTSFFIYNRRLHTVKVGKDSIAIMLQYTMTITRDLKRKQSIDSQPQLQDGEGSSEPYMTGKSG